MIFYFLFLVGIIIQVDVLFHLSSFKMYCLRIVFIIPFKQLANTFGKIKSITIV